MEFEHIYKSRETILDMLKIRNCDVSSYENQTKEELNIIFQQHGTKGNSEVDALDIIVDRKVDKDKELDTDIQLKNYKIMVKYLTNSKVRNQNIINCIEDIYEQEILSKDDVLIIITKDKISYQGVLEEYINRLHYRDGTFIQILCLNSLLFNISKHELVPQYNILTNEKKQALIDRLYLEKEDSLPFILVTDPAARYFGMRIGQVCEIEYNNETNGKNKFYRLCVAN